MEKPLGLLLDSLPHDQRIAHYRQFAVDAFRQAHLAQDPALRAKYLAMAAGWHNLAAESQKLMENHGGADANTGAGADTEAQNTLAGPPKH